MINILILNWRDIKNPSAGGAEVFTREVAKRWAEVRHEETLFTSDFSHCKREDVVDEIKVVRACRKYPVYWGTKKHYRKYFLRSNLAQISCRWC